MKQQGTNVSIAPATPLSQASEYVPASCMTYISRIEAASSKVDPRTSMLRKADLVNAFLVLSFGHAIIKPANARPPTGRLR